LYPGKRIGEILLTPTQIYVQEIVELLKKVEVHGLAHITGGGLRNLTRLNEDAKFVINDPFEPQPIFKFLQKYGNIEDREMYQTFNMRMGFTVVVSKEDANEAMKILKKHSKSEVKIVGRLEKGKGVEFQKLGLKF
jgi:phosphoribosylformylglycinamidine cyclo-ligase